MKNKDKNGSAVALSLIFSTVLLVMGLAYSKMTQTAKIQTVQIDERIKLDYLANGLTEMALLKFQLYPADFYACAEAASVSGNISYLEAFGASATEFIMANDQNSISSFNDAGVSLQLASMTILTNQKWRDEVLYIEAKANYLDQFGRVIDKTVTRLVEVQRNSLKP